jgi:DNA repair exonuclease SbcCD nuclease subunit
MRICLLSDLHIARNTPWSRDWEDMDFLISELQTMRKEVLPDFDAALICGDTFNTPRIYQGDVVRFFRILEALGLKNKPIGWINGNHDPGSFHVVQSLNNDVQDLLNGVPMFSEKGVGAVSLDIHPLMGIIGHSYSQNLFEIRSWLSHLDGVQITVTHQSASMFMELGNLDLDQLHPEDFRAPLNIIGDTHVTKVVEHHGMTLVSPGILAPMRSRTELVESNPHIMWIESDYLGLGTFDLDSASINAKPVRKRPFVVIDTLSGVDRLDGLLKTRKESDPPVIVFVEASLTSSVELPKGDHIRMVSYVRGVDTPTDTQDLSIELGDSITVNTMVEVAGQLIPEDSKDRQTTLGLVKELLSADDPSDVAKNYLED